MHETSAQGWCTGMTQRDGIEREVGGGFRMGNTCKSMADSCQCMAKPLKYCKVISLQLIKIIGRKKRTLKGHGIQRKAVEPGESYEELGSRRHDKVLPQELSREVTDFESPRTPS